MKYGVPYEAAGEDETEDEERKRMRRNYHTIRTAQSEFDSSPSIGYRVQRSKCKKHGVPYEEPAENETKCERLKRMQRNNIAIWKGKDSKKGTDLARPKCTEAHRISRKAKDEQHRAQCKEYGVPYEEPQVNETEDEALRRINRTSSRIKPAMQEVASSSRNQVQKARCRKYGVPYEAPAGNESKHVRSKRMQRNNNEICKVIHRERTAPTEDLIRAKTKQKNERWEAKDELHRAQCKEYGVPYEEPQQNETQEQQRIRMIRTYRRIWNAEKDFDTVEGDDLQRVRCDRYGAPYKEPVLNETKCERRDRIQRNNIKFWNAIRGTNTSGKADDLRKLIKYKTKTDADNKQMAECQEYGVQYLEPVHNETNTERNKRRNRNYLMVTHAKKNANELKKDSAQRAQCMEYGIPFDEPKLGGNRRKRLARNTSRIYKVRRAETVKK